PDALNSPQEFAVTLDVRDRPPAAEATVDDEGEGFSCTPYFWVGHRFAKRVTNYRTNGSRSWPGEVARFRPDLAAGTYEVAFDPKTPFPRGSSFVVRVRHRNGEDLLRVTPARDRRIGRFDFARGADGFVDIRAEGGEGLVLADAIRFTRIGSNTDSIRDLVEAKIDAGLFLGAVVCAGTPKGILYHEAFGCMDVDRPMARDCLFDLASVTKVAATATALAILRHEGRFGIPDRLADHLPGLGGRGAAAVTVAQTATHTSGLDNSKEPCKHLRGEELVREVLQRDLTWEPGTRYEYSCLGAIRLGEMVAHLGGQPFGDFCRERVFAPLGLSAAQFGPVTDAERLQRTMKTQVPLGRIRDENAHRVGRPVGNAGLFATAEDLARIAVLWLQEGTLDGQTLFSPEVRREFTRDQTPLPVGRGILWALATGEGRTGAPASLSDQTYYHTGYNGHSLWIDPAANAYVMVLTIWTHPLISAPKDAAVAARIEIGDHVARTILADRLAAD
ncbi:MAG: serine hydrolase, partial [Lentisphaeria bacterium]|nr:serine hydrolase [Lentisphaeria bacterium]